MAQRTIHLLLGKILLEKTEILDANRFLLGSVLPDAISSLSLRDTSHFIKHIEQEKKWYFDLNGFKEQFDTLIHTDDLYLGYYMHLVEDTLYRNFLYRDYHFASHFKTEEEIRILHNDYRLLNMYIIDHYGLTNEVKKPEDFKIQKINEIVEFQVDDFLEEMSRDFLPYENGTSVLITDRLLDEFVEKYADECVLELEAVRKRESYLNPMDYKWKM